LPCWLAERAVDSTSMLVAKPASLPAALPAWPGELAVAAEGRELVQPLGPGVGPLPVEPPLLRVAEPAHLADPIGPLVHSTEYPSIPGMIWG
jgi:hypothetical protein